MLGNKRILEINLYSVQTEALRGEYVYDQRYIFVIDQTLNFVLKIGLFRKFNLHPQTGLLRITMFFRGFFHRI